MEKEDRFRTREVESFFERYPDVPREVIVKEDVLRFGIRFSQPALERASEGRRRSYYIFSYDKTESAELQHGEALKAPDEFRVEGGPYGLRKTNVRGTISYDSPYLIDVLDGEVWLTADGGEKIGKVSFPPVPVYYSRTFEDGTHYAEIVPVVGWGTRAFCTILRKCALWNFDLQCKFCDLNANYDALKKQGRSYTLKKSVDKVVEVMKAIFLEQPADEPRRYTFILSGGSVMSGKGEYADVKFYTDYVRAIKKAIGNRWICHLQAAALDDDGLKRMNDAGVDCYHPNFEVWDERLFKLLCPGKEKFIGRETWIKRMIDAVSVFGEGWVTPAFVAGVELCRPYGFENVDDAIKSTTGGLDFLMSHGVLPRADHWCIEPLSGLKGNPVPPLKYFVELDRVWYRLWEKHKMPQIPGYRDMGPGKSVYQQSGILDMGS
ncbi:MAG: radical SAM protein [Thermodesulfobacteriota bacterium]